MSEVKNIYRESFVLKNSHLFPDSVEEGAHTYAQIPAVHKADGEYHVLYADRGANKKSYIRYVRLSCASLAPIKESTSFYRPDRVGYFDTDGAMPSQFYQYQGRLYLTYNGWNQLTGKPPYLNSSGLLEVRYDSGQLDFVEAKKGPFLTRNLDNISSTVTPWIVAKDSTLEVFYIGTDGWVEINDYYEPLYYVKRAQGERIEQLSLADDKVIKPLDADEVFSRPSICRIGDHFVMAFCSRSTKDFRDGDNSYKIRFAVSEGADLTQWLRTTVVFDGDEAWNDKQTSYPYLLDEGGVLSMFYNGNGFGRSGFGLAQFNKEGLLKCLLDSCCK